MGEAGHHPPPPPPAVVVTGMDTGRAEDVEPNDAIHYMEGHERWLLEG